jgi:transcriptional regulator with XRE-family HTH domain
VSHDLCLALVQEVAGPGRAALAHHGLVCIRLGLSQAAFAARVGFSVSTIRQYEIRRRMPAGPVRTLLRVIAREPTRSLARQSRVGEPPSVQSAIPRARSRRGRHKFTNRQVARKRAFAKVAKWRRHARDGGPMSVSEDSCSSYQKSFAVDVLGHVEPALHWAFLMRAAPFRAAPRSGLLIKCSATEEIFW